MKEMSKTEIKFDAQMRLLNDGAAAFLHLNEDVIDRLEKQVETYGMPRTDGDEIELKNARAVIAEMRTQFERMQKFFNIENFNSSH